MGITEIVLIIAGVIVLALGYLLPAKKKDMDEEVLLISEDEVRKLVDREVDGAKAHISDIIDETVTYAIEKTERSMERVANEKIMAINEYSDTVLEEINKNHKEVLFLYDMLNDKHETLKNTISEASGNVEEVKQAVRDVEISAKELQESVRNLEMAVQEADEMAQNAVSIAQGAIDEVKDYGQTLIDNKDYYEKMAKDVQQQYDKAQHVIPSYEEEMGEKDEHAVEADDAVYREPAKEIPVMPKKNRKASADDGFKTAKDYFASYEGEGYEELGFDEIDSAEPVYGRRGYNEAGYEELGNVQEERLRTEPEILEEDDFFRPIKPPRVAIIHDPDGDYVAPPQMEARIQPEERVPVKERPRPVRRESRQTETKSVNIQFAKGKDNGRNSNERILELHKAGKSNMAIAKELGLGIGEVKLVIDLFEGM